MKDNIRLLKREKSYPINSTSYRYINYDNDYQNKIAFTQNNNVFSNDFINLNRNKTRKINKNNNIHIFQSINNRYNNKFNLDINDNYRFRIDNISLLRHF